MGIEDMLTSMEISGSVSPHSFQLQTPRNLSDFGKKLTISNLIDYPRATRKEELIMKFFNPYEAAEILKIPLYDAWLRDTILEL